MWKDCMSRAVDQQRLYISRDCLSVESLHTYRFMLAEALRQQRQASPEHRLLHKYEPLHQQ